jgi:hypothetical protein
VSLAQLVGVEGAVVHPKHPGSSPLQLEFGCLFLLNEHLVTSRLDLVF